MYQKAQNTLFSNDTESIRCVTKQGGGGDDEKKLWQCLFQDIGI